MLITVTRNIQAVIETQTTEMRLAKIALASTRPCNSLIHNSGYVRVFYNINKITDLTLPLNVAQKIRFRGLHNSRTVQLEPAIILRRSGVCRRQSQLRPRWDTKQSARSLQSDRKSSQRTVHAVEYFYRPGRRCGVDGKG